MTINLDAWILIFDRIPHFYAKNNRKNFLSNYKITIIIKIKEFLGQFKCLSFLNDRLGHIHAKKAEKNDVELKKALKTP